MSNCVNTSTEEFQNLVSVTNINPIILAAKVSLWQEINGLDKFPSATEALNVGQEELDLSLGEATDNLDYNSENFKTFRRTYTENKIALAEESFTNFLENRVGADSYHATYSGNRLTKITVKPTGKVKNPVALEKVTQNLFKSLKNISDPSFNIFRLVPKGPYEAYTSTIEVKYTQDFLQAYALGVEKSSLDDFKKLMVNRFRETLNLDTITIPDTMNLEGMKELLENAKQSPQMQFQGAYNPLTGQEYNKEQFIKFLNENIQALELAEQEEDLDYSIVSNNNSVLVDPTYSLYEEQRKKQIKNLEVRIQALENKRDVEGSTTDLKNNIVSLRNLKKSFEDDLSVYNQSVEKEELIKHFFNKDFQLIEDLLAVPNIENFFIAEDAADFITLNLDFTSHEEGIFRKEKSEDKFSPTIDTFLKEARHTASNLKIKIDSARDNYFEDILTKYETNLQQLYPGQSISEIKEQILKNLEDIYWAEAQLLPVNRNLFSESDMIAQLLRLEFEYQVHKIKPSGQRLIQKINTLLPNVEKALFSLGIPAIKTAVLGKKVPDYTQLFYRKDSKGNLTSELVSRYSSEWETYSRSLSEYDNNLREARLQEDWNKLETILNDKYYNLRHNTDFVDFRLLSDIDAYLSPEGLTYVNSSKSSVAGDSNTYSANLKASIGKTEYDNLVKNQAFKIEEFLVAKNNYLRDFMKKEKVNSYNALSDKSKLNLEVITKRLDPNELLNSHFNSDSNNVPYTIGTQTYTKKHYMSYNSFIPKKLNSTNEDTKFFDDSFDTINNNPDLKNFWETLEEAIVFINNNLSDSSLRLKPRTILHLKKGMIESLMGKGFSASLQGVTGEAVWENSKGLIKDLVSQKNAPKLKNKEIILPSNVNSFNQLVNEDFSVTKLQLSNLLKIDVDNNTTLNWNNLLETQKKSLYEILGINGAQEFLDEVSINTKGQFKVAALKVFNEKAIMDQQTIDLPSLIKSFVELSMLHKARVEARDSAKILLAESEKVRNREGKRTEVVSGEDKKQESWDKKRTNAARRNEMFVKTVIENDSSVKGFGNISERKRKKFETADVQGKLAFLGKSYYKNFSLDEKRLYKVFEERSSFIKNKLENEEITPEQRTKYEKELDSIHRKVTLMGKDYMASAAWSNAVNRTSRFVGLALNVAAMTTNYLNARAAFFNRDGEFWPEGAAYAAFAFVDMNASRHINPEYKKQWNTLEALIYQLDLIQDGTNELQKAQKTGAISSPKIWELKRWVENPFYATELIEWYNQVPVILATGTAIKIAHPTTGVEVPLFDGTGFPAHERDEATGRLKLKDEYRSEENIKDFENFDTPKMIQWKTLITTGINSLNGDYSLAGNILAKQSVAGQSVMMFKTWAGEYFHSRWAYDQKDLATGKIKDGFILGSLADKNTRGLGSALLAGNTLGAAIMLPAAMAGIQAALFLPVLGTLAITGGLTYVNRKKIKGAMSNSLPHQLSFWDQLKYFAKITTVGTVELPVNMMWSVARFLTSSVAGKPLGNPTLINIDASLGGKLTDPRAVTNLRNLSKVYQKSNLYMMIALMLELGLGDDEEDEKKGSKEWVEQELKKEENKPIYNLIRNLNTKMYNEENLGHNIIPAANLFIGDDATHMGPLEGIGKTAYYAASGDTYEKQGMYYGDSKWSVNARKTFLPSIVRNIDKEEWAGGFENMMQDVYVKNTAVDKMFKTDLAADKSEVKEKRKETREALKLRLSQEKYSKEYNDLTPGERYIVDKKAEKQALKDVPTPKRKDYDEEQNKVE